MLALLTFIWSIVLTVIPDNDSASGQERVSLTLGHHGFLGEEKHHTNFRIGKNTLFVSHIEMDDRLNTYSH